LPSVYKNVHEVTRSVTKGAFGITAYSEEKREYGKNGNNGMDGNAE
jgi:hypothetical protein